MEGLDCGVGETVKLRKRNSLCSDDIVLKKKLLLEEERKIAKLKATIHRRERRAERKRKDKERMDKGNLELLNETSKGDEIIRWVKSEKCGRSKKILVQQPLSEVKRAVSFSDVGMPNPQEVESQELLYPTPQNLTRVTTKDIKAFNFGKVFGDKMMETSEFSLPKEYTALKLEKIRENNVLSQSLPLPRGRTRTKNKCKIDPSYSEDREYKGRRKRLVTVEHMDINEDMSVEDVENFKDVLQISCHRNQLGNSFVVCCMCEAELSVWLCQEVSISKWEKVGNFTHKGSPFQPFLMADSDTIQVKNFFAEGSTLKETSYVLLGDNSDFSLTISSTRTVLVLTESKPIKSVIFEAIGEAAGALFHNLDNFTRGSVLEYNGSELEVKFLATVEGETVNLKKVEGMENMVASFTLEYIYIWDTQRGMCLHRLAVKMMEFPQDIVKLCFSDRFYFFDKCEESSELRVCILKEEGKFSFLKEISSVPVPNSLLSSSGRITVKVSDDMIGLVVGSRLMKFEMTTRKLVSMMKLTETTDIKKFIELFYFRHNLV